MRTIHFVVLALLATFTVGLPAAEAGKPPSECGNGIAEPGEGCDGSDFRGETCQTLGYSGGQLVCTSICHVDTSGCFCAGGAIFPGDGAGNGPELSYTDNGDGTVTDNNTLLMWEKKDDNGGIHDKDNFYSWTDSSDGDQTNPVGTLFTDFLNLNNTCDGAGVTDCTSTGDTACGTGKCGLAGHRDWRIPNIKELQSIVDYGTALAIDPTFPGLTDVFIYWSSTTFVIEPDSAWGMDFGLGYGGTGSGGFNNVFSKNTLNLRARAVRGGS